MLRQPQHGKKPSLILVVHASVGSGHRSAAEAVAAALMHVDGRDRDIRESTGDTGTEEGRPASMLRVQVLDILDFGRVRFNGDRFASMFTGFARPYYDITWRYSFTGRLLWGGGTIWARIMFPKFVDYVRQNRPDAIVATHITAANVAVGARMLLEETFPIICVPTDYEVEGLWPHKYTDLFCVANEQMAETLRPRHIPRERIEITGIPANPDFSKTYDRDEVRTRFNLPLDKTVVLFLAGATLPRPYINFRNSVELMVPYLYRFPDMHMVIIAGKDSGYERHMRKIVQGNMLTNVEVFGYVDEMAALMSASDVCICKPGGLTVTECLCAQVPMILLGRAYGQEKANMSMLTAEGAAYHVTTVGELLALLQRISKDPEMAHSVLKSASYIRQPHAAMNIARCTFSAIDQKKNLDDPLYRKHFVHLYFGGRPAHIR